MADLEQQVDTATAELDAQQAAHKALQREFTEATTQAERRYQELLKHRDVFSKSTDTQHVLANQAGAEVDGLKDQIGALTGKLVTAEAGWDEMIAQHREAQELHRADTAAAADHKLQMETALAALESEFKTESDSLEEYVGWSVGGGLTTANHGRRHGPLPARGPAAISSTLVVIGSQFSRPGQSPPPQPIPCNPPGTSRRRTRPSCWPPTSKRSSRRRRTTSLQCASGCARPNETRRRPRLRWASR